MVPIALGIASLVGTIAVGLFVINLVDRRPSLAVGYPSGDERDGGRAYTHVHQRWQALEIEPYRIPWPSEMPHTRRPLPEMHWPSETWDDPYFGAKGNRTEAPLLTSLTGNAPLEPPRERRQRRQEPAPSKAETAFFESEPQPRRAEPDPVRPEPTPTPAVREPAVQTRMAAVALEQARRQQAQAKSEPRPAPGPRPSPKPAPRPTDDGLPDVDTLKGWVEQYGLAGAVSKLRTKTGWDFQRAARYVAQQLSGRG